MTSLLNYMIWVYLLILIALICLSAILYFRSSRTPVYYAQILCCLALLFNVYIKILTGTMPPSSWLKIIITLDLLAWSTALATVVLAYYSAIVRKRFALFLQMGCGAGALLLFFFLLPLTDTLYQEYLNQQPSQILILFWFLPLILVFIYIPLLAFLIKRHLVNTTSLSFFHVMHLIPDTFFVFDPGGQLIDQNHSDQFLPGCRHLADLKSGLQLFCRNDCQAIVKALEKPGQRLRGELEWQRDEAEQQTWSWSCQALSKNKDKPWATLLVLTNLTESRRASHQLQEQNEELSQINQQLADYREVIENYAGAATQQEIAHLIDASVRRRLDNSLEKLTAVRSSPRKEGRLLVDSVISECRQALEDIRDLVKRLSEA